MKMRSPLLFRASILIIFLLRTLLVARAGPPQQNPKDLANVDRERIVSAAEAQQAANPDALWPVRIVSAPVTLLNFGMQRGLMSFEKHRMRERLNIYRQYLTSHGITAMIGGLGEGSGFGLGVGYGVQMGDRRPLQFVGRGTFLKGYQEFGAKWDIVGALMHRLSLEGNYQWRPQENFYGLGQDSRKDQRSNFALRQTWTGARYEFRPHARLAFGTEYRQVWASAHDGTNSVYASTGEMFPGLPGYGVQTRLETMGVYVDANGIRGEYNLGGSVNVAASRQRGLGSSNLDYFLYEVRLEGRLPLIRGNGVLVAQGSSELNRLRGGSDPIPFYILPHIGGSSTMRGFPLDRFYGLNLLMATIEYRYRIHPNFQILTFFDEGQIFDKTADLSWLNWHRNYGLGFRMHTVNGTVMRVEYGWGEGSHIHITFGDREVRPLGGPVRSASYRR